MAEERAFEKTKSEKYEDPSARIWSVYISEAEKHDRALARNWKGDMDAILIFAGLFSASLTAFIVESYKTLIPDPTDASYLILVQISRQLAAMSNTTLTIPASITEPFVPTTSAYVCNTLWFLSLGFSLTCALSATLVEQWARNYLEATQSRMTPHLRARICAYLYQGLAKFGMAAVVETIPLLLHISLLLFFAGLVEFLWPINVAMGYLVLAMLALCITLYATITILPIIYSDCPYRTPLSSLWWRILRTMRLLRRRDAQGGDKLVTSSMAETRNLDATDISSKRDDRDLEAMCWTMASLRDSSELEPFVEVIPKVVAGYDYSAKLLLHKLLHHNDTSVRLGHRIRRLLVTCMHGRMEPIAAQKRATTCLSAIWSLTMMSVPVSDGFQATLDILQTRDALRFDEHTLKDVREVKNNNPAVAGYAVSTMVVVARSLIDIRMARASTLEKNLLSLPHFPDERIAAVLELEQRHSSHIMRRIRQNIVALEQHILSQQSMTSPLLYMIMDAFQRHVEEFLDDIPFVCLRDTDILDILRTFRRLLNQAGFSLALEYISHILETPTLPYEATNTIRRLFLQLKFDSPYIRPTPDSQALFVRYLDEALEPATHGSSRKQLPESLINVLLSLIKAVDDPVCAMKAKGIVHRYLELSSRSISGGTSDAAEKALRMLDETLPLHSRPAPTLDIFSSHMYANTRIERMWEVGGQGKDKWTPWMVEDVKEGVAYIV